MASWTGRGPANRFDGRILVDVSNAETPDGRGLVLGHDTSGAAQIAAAAQNARVIKAFNDAGPLRVARYLEPFAMLTVQLVREQGWGPEGIAWRLMRSVMKTSGNPEDS